MTKNSQIPANMREALVDRVWRGKQSRVNTLFLQYSDKNTGAKEPALRIIRDWHKT